MHGNIEINTHHVLIFIHNYNAAVCEPMCSNRGTCISPGTCNCTAGWSGSTCSQG